MTADLRREEIARIEDALRAVDATGDAYSPFLAPYGIKHNAPLLYDAGLRGSQDTATARIAALNVAALRDAIESVPCQSARPPGHRPVIDWSDLERLRAVLSGETRTGGET